MNERDRATGWKHAKLSGHENEEKVKTLLDSDKEYAKELLKRLGLKGNIKSTQVGGIHEKNVIGIMGKNTKSKTDLKIHLDNEETVNISIKKSESGQIYFIRATAFISVFEKQFSKQIPESVKRAIKLFWSEANDAISIIEEYSSKNNEKIFKQQIRHKSVNAQTLRNYDEKLYSDMINWFRKNISEIAKLTFAMGAVSEEKEWAEYIWYINLLKENDNDEIFKICDICKQSKINAKKEVSFGIKNGGTTIQLPFGFVEWHHGKMQFHAERKKIKKLLNK